MKLCLTLAEAINVIRNSVLHGNLTVEIIVDDPAPKPIGNGTANYIEAIHRAQYEYRDYERSQKIMAIKRLRELTGIGLAEAKYAIERPTVAIEHYLKTGKILNTYFDP